MMLQADIINKMNKLKTVAVIRGESKEEAFNIAKASIEGGINIIELTYTTPDVEDLFKALDIPDAIIGAGTVLDVQTARSAILKGAKFVVSPHFDVDIAKLCNRYSILYMPGCMTVKEVIHAMDFGCSIIKLFPANIFQPNIIKAIRGPLPNVEIMPTGGINLDNINDWIDADALAVGIGSDLTKAYQQSNEKGVIELAQKYMATIRRNR